MEYCSWKEKSERLMLRLSETIDQLAMETMCIAMVMCWGGRMLIS